MYRPAEDRNSAVGTKNTQEIISGICSEMRKIDTFPGILWFTRELKIATMLGMKISNKLWRHQRNIYYILLIKIYVQHSMLFRYYQIEIWNPNGKTQNTYYSICFQCMWQMHFQFRIIYIFLIFINTLVTAMRKNL